MKNQCVCKECGTVGAPVKSVPGYFLVEVIMYLMFFIPGVIYTLWRVTNATSGCPKCGGKMIPADSPEGIKLIGGKVS